MKFQIPEISTSKTSHNLPPPMPTCTTRSCFFCILSETDPSVRRTKISQYFKQMPFREDQEHILVLSGLWKIAMTNPNDPEFPSLGIFTCMAKLITKGVSDRTWLLKHQNIYIPYYAAHIIGSYTMKKPKFAKTAVKSLVVQPLVELLQGKITWIEQRVAFRALGHIINHEATFEAIKNHEAEIIEAAINIASTCLNEVYDNFVGLKGSQRLEYHRNLLTRGLGGLELENRKAEEWASQLQCWSLYLLHCFACRKGSLTLRLICKKKQFLKDLCGMWGGLSNPSSPSGIGLLKTLCRTQMGRESIAELQEVIESFCNVARSSDERQHMAIESLLQLLRDPITRYKVIDKAAPVLADLVELRNTHEVGKKITKVLLQDYHKIKFFNLTLSKGQRAMRTIEELWDYKAERVKREKLMSGQEMREREALLRVLKKEGNKRFSSGEIEKAMKKYSEALDLCPLRLRKERIVLHSNRAQCHLLLKDAEGAISDATRALCLSSVVCPHSKSLWRRSQAYDMKGLAKESLMDCLAFIGTRFRSCKTKGFNFKIPYYAARFFNKQMNSTWPFDKAMRHRKHEELKGFMMGKNHVDFMNLRKKTRRKMKGCGTSVGRLLDEAGS